MPPNGKTFELVLTACAQAEEEEDWSVSKGEWWWVEPQSQRRLKGLLMMWHWQGAKLVLLWHASIRLICIASRHDSYVFTHFLFPVFSVLFIFLVYVFFLLATCYVSFFKKI